MFVRPFCSRSAVRCCSLGSTATMPLRAKITNAAFASKAPMSTERKWKPLSEMTEEERNELEQHKAKSRAQSQEVDLKRKNEKEAEGKRKAAEEAGKENTNEDVLFNTLFGLRTIELNRPKKLHSLNGSMIEKITPRLQEWAKSDMANVVVIKGSGDKAFCAGGDVSHLARDNKEGSEGQARSTGFFAQEYKLNHLIATYSKPYVAIMDGITMGGGVGLSIHAPFRIATERTVFAMPETTIGFFPDVGASFFLPRMPGGVGTYLALTSEKLKGVNVYYSGIATHYIHSSSLPALERRLAELRFVDWMKLDERLQLINSTIEEFTTGLPHDEPILLAGRTRNMIDNIFGDSKTFEEVYRKLQEDQDDNGWKAKTLESLRKRSPTAVNVAFRQMKLGKYWSITETFQREHQIAAKFMKHPDFTEGVHALLIRKDKPTWEYQRLEDFAQAQKGSSSDLIDPFFEFDGNQKLELLTNGEYTQYPHLKYGIPHENLVEYVVKESGKSGGKSSKEIIDHFVTETRGKMGVREVIAEIINRKTYTVDGKLFWGPKPKPRTAAPVIPVDQVEEAKKL